MGKEKGEGGHRGWTHSARPSPDLPLAKKGEALGWQPGFAKGGSQKKKSRRGGPKEGWSANDDPRIGSGCFLITSNLDAALPRSRGPFRERPSSTRGARGKRVESFSLPIQVKLLENPSAMSWPQEDKLGVDWEGEGTSQSWGGVLHNHREGGQNSYQGRGPARSRQSFKVFASTRAGPIRGLKKGIPPEKGVWQRPEHRL